MRLSILRDDNVVVVDGVVESVSCAELPSYVRAIQWDGERGEIELHRDATGMHQSNLKITEIGPYLYLLDRWRLKHAETQLAAQQASVDAAESAAVFAQTQFEQQARESERVEMKLKIADLEAQQAELSARLAEAERKLSDAS